MCCLFLETTCLTANCDKKMEFVKRTMSDKHAMCKQKCFYLFCCLFVCVDNVFISDHLNKVISSHATAKFWHAYNRALLHSECQLLFCCEAFFPKDLIHFSQILTKKVSKFTVAYKWSGGNIQWQRMKHDLEEIHM